MYYITLTLLKNKCLLSVLSVCLQLRYTWQAVGLFCIHVHTMFWKLCPPHPSNGQGVWGEVYKVFSIGFSLV